MSKNVFAYSFRFMAVLMTAVMFASCEKDTFTEANALDLELRKLRVQDSIANVKRVQDHKNAIAILQYQRQIDSLAAIDAGGKVFYSVVPVSATSAVWTSGGRAEDIQGVEGATVTISQYGRVIEAEGAKNGVYAFPMLHSGEVTVTIKAPNHTTVNYIANLTPDGPVANGKIVYVGNIIPLFEISTDVAKMATISGKAWIETDLTNSEEEIPAGASMVAVIDASNPAFKTRFVDEYNGVDEATGVTSANQGSASNTRSGFIQKMAYESAVTRTTVQANGDYSMLAPATGAGLPIKMEFSEFAADRTFFREGQRVTARFVYGPNVAADMIPNGGDNPTVSFQAFTTPATGTGTYTPGSTSGTYVTNVDRTGTWGKFVSPTTTVEGTAGTGATATVALNATVTAGNTPFRAFNNVTARITAGGTDYTSDGTVVYTFTDHLALGNAEQLASTAGTGIAQYVRIQNGGSNFIPNGAVRSSTPGVFTNRLPKLEFLVGGSVPVTGQQPNAEVVIDQTGIGTISFVSVGFGGAGFTAPPTVRARYAFPSAISITGTRANGIFQLGSDGRSLQFSSAIPAAGLNQIAALSVDNNFTTTTSSIAFTSTGGSSAVYTFVPKASVIAAATNGPGPIVTTPQIQVTVNTDRNDVNVGRVLSISMNGGDFSAAFFTGANGQLAFSDRVQDNFTITLTLEEPSNPLAFYPTILEGAGLNNYSFTPTNPPPTSPAGGFQVTVPTFQFASAATNPGNTSDQRLTNGAALDLITANEFIIVASNPTATVADPSHAYGIPVYDNGAIAGIRMIWGGSGYVAGTTYALEIMPNPFYGFSGTAQIANHVTRNDTNLSINGLTNQFAFNVVGSAARKFVEDRYNRSVPNRQATIGGYVRVNTPAKLTITIDGDGGAGYATNPYVAVYAGERLVNLGVSNNATINGEVRVIEGGKVRFADANSTALTRTWEVADINEFTQHGIALTNLKVYFIDRASEALTREFARRQNLTDPTAYVDVTQTGTIAGIHLSGRDAATRNFTSVTYSPLSAGTQPIDWNHPPQVRISAPSTTGGVTATAQAVVGIDPGAANAGGGFNGVNFSTAGTDTRGRITSITVTNPGSGYIPGNRFYNRGANSRGPIEAGETFAGQPFRIIGGISTGTSAPLGTGGNATGFPNGNPSDDFGRTESNTRFDVFPGISYVRDVHYGTGREVE